MKVTERIPLIIDLSDENPPKIATLGVKLSIVLLKVVYAITDTAVGTIVSTAVSFCLYEKQPK